MSAEGTKIPTDLVYEEGMSLHEPLPDAIPSCTGDEISWDACKEVSEEIREFTTRTAAQFHYAKVSHILLYRNMMMQEAFTSLETHRLAVLLSTYNVNRLELWETYLEQMDAEATVLDELRDYYRRLFDEDDPLVQLIALETLGVSAKVLYNHLQHVGDNAFQQINAMMLDQKREELAFVTEHIQDNMDLSEEERTAIITALPPYIELLESIITTCQDAFESVNIDTKTLQDDLHRELKAFYTDIGLR